MTDQSAPTNGSANRHSNPLVSFLRHYGPIPASDNMYDELIQAEIAKHGIDPPIGIDAARLPDLLANFASEAPRNVILTGTAGDGKTYHCRRVWQEFGGDPHTWQRGEKIVRLNLPGSGRELVVVKDLSELSAADKLSLVPGLMAAIAGETPEVVYLVAANDGQLVATWRSHAEAVEPARMEQYRVLEGMLVEGRVEDDRVDLLLFNLSRLDASEHFDALVEQLVEHPQWSRCSGCDLIAADGRTTCPILINRDLLRRSRGASTFRDRLKDLLRLAGTNRMHLPIRDLLLLAVNVILGDQQPGQPLLTCRTARNRAAETRYASTNPYANVFGANLAEKDRQKYQAFSVLESFGIGRETDNRFDNLLIYGHYADADRYARLVGNDPHYGAAAYQGLLREYLEGDRESVTEFLGALERQRMRLFFSLGAEDGFDAWMLSVYRSAGTMLAFARSIRDGEPNSAIIEHLVRGLNRSFCGMMIDDGGKLYLASSGGDGRGRIASILDHEIGTSANSRYIFARFELAPDGLTPRLAIIDPTRSKDRQRIEHLDLQLTHFEYLMRVAGGSLPASFSRQCYEDFLDFKLRLTERMNVILDVEASPNEVSLNAITVDDDGRTQVDRIQIRTGAQ